MPAARRVIASLDRSTLAVGAMALAYAVVYSILCAVRYRNYLYTDFDLAIFAQACDGLLRGRLFSSIRGMNWLGDHSSLILFLLVPLYALARHPVTLLVVQSAAQGLGALAVCALAKRELGHGGLALACAASYLVYPALGYANLFEFHPETLATPALLTAFHFLRAGRLRATLAWAGVALLCREDVALVIVTMALYALWLPHPRRLRFALALAAAGVASTLLSWGILRPAFSHGEAEYARIYARWGSTPGAALLHMLRDPLGVATALVSTPGDPRDSLIKLQYHMAILLPVGLLPLLSPVTMAMALPALMEHLLSWRTAQHTVLCQYTALVTPFVFAATVMGVRNLLGWIGGAGTRTGRGRRKARPHPQGNAVHLAMAWVIVSTLGCHLWFGPLLSSGRFFLVPTLGRHAPTGEERTLARERDRLIRRVPPRGGVVASFEMLSRFTARDSVHSLHHVARGAFTFSSRTYPVPVGISALIADVSAVNVVGHVDAQSHRRLWELVQRNGLVPVAVAGDLLLMVTGAREPVELVSFASCPSPGARAIVFDRQLAYQGGELLDLTARPGGLVRMRTCWQRTGPSDRLFRMRLRLVDAGGQTALEHVRDLGYLLFPPHAWHERAIARETYRLLLPDDLRPGDYRLVMSVLWRAGGGSGSSRPDDALRYTPDEGLELGRIRVAP